MGRIAKFIKQKLALLVAIALAAAVGSVTTGLVMAAIPDSSGQIRACYRTSGLLANGQVRIIDQASQNCTANEAALSWDTGAIAYARIITEQDPDTGAMIAQLDTQNSSGVVEVTTGLPEFSGAYNCIKLAQGLVPRHAQLTSGAQNVLMQGVEIMGQEFQPGQINQVCGDGYHLLVNGGQDGHYYLRVY